jgi:tetrahydromethanopterin S-methyltransferase subunit G
MTGGPYVTEIFARFGKKIGQYGEIFARFGEKNGQYG